MEWTTRRLSSIARHLFLGKQLEFCINSRLKPFVRLSKYFLIFAHGKQRGFWRVALLGIAISSQNFELAIDMLYPLHAQEAAACNWY